MSYSYSCYSLTFPNSSAVQPYNTLWRENLNTLPTALAKGWLSAPRSNPIIHHFCQEKVPLSCTPRKYDNPFVLTFYVVTLRKCYNHILVKGPFKYLNYQFPCSFIYLNLRSPYPWPFVYLKREKGVPRKYMYPPGFEPPRIKSCQVAPLGVINANIMLVNISWPYTKLVWLFDQLIDCWLKERMSEQLMNG